MQDALMEARMNYLAICPINFGAQRSLGDISATSLMLLN
jgi:hypothetical protein